MPRQCCRADRIFLCSDADKRYFCALVGKGRVNGGKTRREKESGRRMQRKKKKGLVRLRSSFFVLPFFSLLTAAGVVVTVFFSVLLKKKKKSSTRKEKTALRCAARDSFLLQFRKRRRGSLIDKTRIEMGYFTYINFLIRPPVLFLLSSHLGSNAGALDRSIRCSATVPSKLSGSSSLSLPSSRTAIEISRLRNAPCTSPTTCAADREEPTSTSTST